MRCVKPTISAELDEAGAVCAKTVSGTASIANPIPAKMILFITIVVLLNAFTVAPHDCCASSTPVKAAARSCLCVARGVGGPHGALQFHSELFVRSFTLAVLRPAIRRRKLFGRR
jgi:hypothetical protein